MKKRLFIFLAIVAVIMCLFAVSASAATPDTTRESYTLTDGTVCHLWDTDGNALIWYISGTDSETGATIYKYISVADTTAESGKASINFPCTWVSGSKYQLGGLVITDENGATFDKTKVVVANLEGAKLTSGNTNGIGKEINCFSESFSGNTNLQYVKLPVGTIGIYKQVFNSCSSLVYVNFSELTNLVDIGQQTFNNCTKLAIECDLSGSKLAEISSGAFNSCAITTLVLPNTLKTLNDWCLQGLTNVTEIAIPESVTAVHGANTFKDCQKLEKVTGFASLFERGVLTTIPKYTFLRCYNLASLDMPEGGYTSIGEGAFQNCKMLFSGVDFVVPNECTSIGSVAFEKTLIKSVRLGGTYTTLYSNTFRDCSKLAEIYMSDTVTIVQSEAFRGLPSNTVIFFVGSQASATTLKDNVTNSLNSCGANYNDTIVNATILSLDEYNALQNKNGRYIVYDYNICDAFYAGNCNTEGDDGNCETALMCGRGNCTRTALEAKTHIETHDVLYAEGFLSAGVHLTYCSNTNCTELDAEEDLDPMFAPDGYSYRMGDQTGISAKFKINTKALVLYETHEEKLVFGIIIANQNHVQDSFLKDGKLNTLNNKGLQVVMGARTYSYFTCFITGFDMNNELHTSLGLVIAGYVHAENDNQNVTYFQKSYEGSTPYAGVCEKDVNLNVVTIGKVKEFSGE